MKTFLLSLATLLVSFQFQAQSIIVSDREIPTQMDIQNVNLKLNGAGIREKFFMDMYVGGLYLLESPKNGETVINLNQPMAIKIHIVSGLISSKKMINAVEDGFKNSTDGNEDKYQKKIDEFISFFKDDINKEDVFDILYHPKRGSSVYKNNSKKGTIEGFGFKQALFGIWLSDNPVDDDLKEAMLKI